MNPIPMVSVLIPCRNEVRFIRQCLDSVLANGYALDRLEVLVMDGMSDDGTRNVIKTYQARYEQIRLLDNDLGVTPYALNIGIREARGDVLMRLDAHTTCEKGYINRCVRVLLDFGADDVGGTLRITARDDTLVGQAIVKALTQRFGVGNLRYRFSQSDTPEVVDTVAFFCCKKELFRQVGLFNENLTRIQDMEFKRRLVRAGCKIMLVPGAFADYQARSDLKSFWRHNWADGLWTVLAFAHSDLMPVRWRHLVPACFAGSLIVTGLLMILFPIFLWAFLLIVGVYGAVALGISIKIARADGELRYLLMVPTIITIMHLARGLGSLWGAIRLVVNRKFMHAVRLALQEAHR
jgi:cellulose synthase/poly-beta-1,6-N-acetylglucosamine synthase-like glycosyltransferase